MSHYTLQIFRHLFDNLPPLFPDHLEKEMADSLKQFETQEEVELSVLEKEMIKHGFRIWPFSQAHKEFLSNAINELGDHFLEPHLSEDVQKKYQDFKSYGGNWHELYSGRAVDFFDHDERVEISRGLVEAKNKLKEYVAQDVVGLSKEKYLDRVNKYTFLLSEIQTELNDLRKLADKEDHDALAEQIRKKIEDVEHSFAHLGKELQYHEVFSLVDFFRGRKDDLSRLRGIDIPIEIDFFNK